MSDHYPSQLCVTPVSRLQGEVCVPGDKSISHRAIMLASIAQGDSEIKDFLWGSDTLATMDAFRHMGVTIRDNQQDQTVFVAGVGLRGLNPSPVALDMGNSGTAMRLLTGLLAGQHFSSELVGDASLSARPMQRVVTPLAQMQAAIKLSTHGTAPIRIDAVASLQAIDYHLPIVSAQVKSAVLLAGMYAQGETYVTVPGISRDHTERMLSSFGYPVTVVGNRISLVGGHQLQGSSVRVPADISSAAFFMVAASIVPNSLVTLVNVGINPSRLGVITLLRLMGADITLSHKRFFGAEPVADIVVKSARLHGIDIPQQQVPLAIDELPVLMIAAACAEGITRLSGAAELRVKESDRIDAMHKGLMALGIDCEATKDGMVVKGGRFQGGSVDSLGDHRIAMAFAVAACVAENPIDILHCENIQTSFPNFIDLARKLGFVIREKN